MNIIFIGLRGSGKTKLGKLLSQKLNLEFIDIDKEIEKKEKTKIPEIIKLKNWDYFRTIENKTLKTLSKKTNCIISTGGGIILNKENIKILKKLGKIIYLNVHPEICTKRIEKSSTNRPKLTNKKTIQEEIISLYEKRKNIYEKTADIIFERSENLKKDMNSLLKITSNL